MKYYSITVAYHPNENLESQIKCLLSAGLLPIVVFNSKYQGHLDTLKDILIIKNETNVGLAKAINLGVSDAMREGCDGFILFDQDSVPTKEMISKLIRAAEDLNNRIGNLGSIGPQIFNQSDNSVWPVPVSRENQLVFINRFEHEFVEAEFLITSGIFIFSKVWKNVGGYREDFFIDGLDIEWGYRAKSLGYKNFVFGNSKLLHNLGDRSVQILPFLKKRMIVHSAIRRFYMYRNYLWMLYLPHIPKQFKIHYGLKLSKMLLGILLSPLQWASVIKIFLGIRQGLFFRPKTLAKTIVN